MRVIEVTFENGDIHEVSGIPDDAKITFAQLNPGTTRQYDRDGVASLTLRIYKGARDNGNQLAVFRNVESFVDKSLTITPKKQGKVKQFI